MKWNNHITPITIALIALIPAMFLVYSDQIFQANVIVNVIPETFENYTETKVILTNEGSKQATNVRITINPQYPILNFSNPFYTDKIDYVLNGNKSLIGQMDRFANGQNLKTTVNLDTTDKLERYYVYVTHDTGSTTYKYTPKKLLDDLQTQLELAFILTITVMMTLLITVFLKEMILRKN
ncbi:MAG: hypothetical protein HRU07_03900 [Nitrosopumilus sp.]|nr:hypothetical protein [Nitrosopumilus sp.]NRA05299.1 hypothetical protein [Nitrosopumilus sp.]